VCMCVCVCVHAIVKSILQEAVKNERPCIIVLVRNGCSRRQVPDPLTLSTSNIDVGCALISSPLHLGTQNKYVE
jgi:hypothetical protein